MNNTATIDSSESSKSFEEELEEAKKKYPVGSVVEIEIQDHEEPPRFSELEELPETWKVRVTGHKIHDQTILQDGSNLYPEEELGVRVNVSDNPPERIAEGGTVENDLDFVKAGSVKPENILEVKEDN